MANFKLDHVGWVTHNIELFEKFWIGVLGFKCTQQGQISAEMVNILFGAHIGAMTKKYEKQGWDVKLEIHYFGEDTIYVQNFDMFGINHICLHTGGPGSKEQFLQTLPSDVAVHKYNNPGGWTNVFLQDYEGNWIELREDLNA